LLDVLILLAIMSLAMKSSKLSFDTTSDAKEPLIATGDVEEEDPVLEKNLIISTLSLCSWD
jgi:hypothetical protein